MRLNLAHLTERQEAELLFMLRTILAPALEEKLAVPIPKELRPEQKEET